MSTIIPKNPLLYGLYRFFPPSVYGPAPQNPAPWTFVDRWTGTG